MKKTKNKLISLLLTLVMVVGMIPLTASAANTRTWNGQTWTEWTSTTSLPTSGSYYLANDVTMSKTNLHINGTTLYLDLNGKTITFSGNLDASAINVYSNGKFYLYDSVGGGQIYCQTRGTYQRAVYINGGTFNMYSGKINNFGKSNEDGAGVIILDGNFNMYGGTITYCKGQNGGAVCVANDHWGHIYMHGGTISYCTAAGNGGAVDASNDDFHMYGGTITWCTAGNLGGAVSAWDGGGSFEMAGGTISYCTANVDGGAVYCCGKSVTMSGGSLLYNTASTASGGAIAASNNASITVSGGEIAYNTSKGTDTSIHGGGAIASWAGVNITVKGTAYIHDNKARQGGAIYCPNTNASGSITISGGYIAQPDGTTYNIYARQITPTYNSGRLYTGSNYYNSSSLNNKYSTVTLNANSGTGGTASVSSQYWNTAMKSATMPTRTGYTFNGYYNATSGGDQYYTSTGASARNWDYIGNQTLYAQWTPITYTIAYNANGGSDTPANQSATYDVNATLAAAPTRTGYTFAGWKTGDTTYNANASVTNLTSTNGATVTLTAQWTPNTYTVTLNNQSATTAGSTSVTATYNAVMSSATMPTKTGYTFNGYFDAETDGTQYYNADGTSARAWDKAEDTTLYAQWTPNSYSITYKDNGGADFSGENETDAPTHHTYGTDTVLKDATKRGYTFGGWFTASNCTGTAVTSLGATAYTENITLYAQWTPNTYTVTLNNVEEADRTKLTSYTYGVGANLPDPTRSKYHFLGWFDNDKFDGEEVTAIGKEEVDNKTFYAKWQTVTDAHLESGKCDVGGLMGHQYSKDSETIGRTIIGLTEEMLGRIGTKLVIVGGDQGEQTTLSIDCAYTYFYDDNKMITAKSMNVAAFVIIENDGKYNPISGYGYYRLYSDIVDDENNFLFDVMYKKPVNN